jgi:hypothetical protein
MTPGAGSIFTLWLLMFHAKYLSSRAFGFLQEDFLVLLYINQMTPLRQPLEGFYLNKLLDVSCQISKL